MGHNFSNKRRRATSIVEVLVAAALLAVSMAAATVIWSVSRNISARSRDTAEYYAIARQEVERDKFLLFKPIFVTPGTRLANVSFRTDYTETGGFVANGMASGAAPSSATTFYRAQSTYSLVATGNETIPTRKLGIQKIQVFRRVIGANSFEGTPIYETAVFYTAPGV